MTDTLFGATITDDGVYDITATAYHDDPVDGGSLSSSGARKILDCPAKYAYERAHGARPKRVFEFGHAAHNAVLGVGPEMVVLDYDNYRTKAAQSNRDAAREAGKVPLLVDEAEIVIEMGNAIRDHPVAGSLFRPGTGKAEQSLFHRDRRTGIMLRARFDWLPDAVAGQRLIIPDYKTTTNAHPDAVQKAIAEHGYHIQGAWYRRIARNLGLAPDGAAFVLVCQEKTAPYLVTVVEPSSTALAWGEQLADHAIDLYRECTRTGNWPGYSDDVELRELPRYVEQQYEIARDRGLFDDPAVNR